VNLTSPSLKAAHPAGTIAPRTIALATSLAVGAGASTCGYVRHPAARNRRSTQSRSGGARTYGMLWTGKTRLAGSGSGSCAGASPAPAPIATLSVTSRPALDFGAKPKHGASTAEIEHRSRHVLVPGLILANAVSVSQPQYLSDVLSIDEVVNQDSTRHEASVQRLAAGSFTPVMIPSDKKRRLHV
jgi:hypothetical protein